MVYVDSEEIKYLPFVRSWLQKFDENLLIPEMNEFLLSLFETYVEDGFTFIKKRGTFAIHQVINIMLQLVSHKSNFLLHIRLI